MGQAAAAERVYAGFLRRFAAAMIDIALTGAVWALGFLALIEQRPDTLGMIDLEIWTFLEFVPFLILYHAILEAFGGQTPGKFAVGIRVVNRSGRRAGIWRALARNLAKVLSLCSFGIGFLMAGFTRQRRAMHDLIGGTLVVAQGAAPDAITPAGKTMNLSVMVPLLATLATALTVVIPWMTLVRLDERLRAYRSDRAPLFVEDLGNRSPNEPARQPIPFTRMQGNVGTSRTILESPPGAGNSGVPPP
jgi:uncharacterized RDD family membrane protein YckC